MSNLKCAVMQPTYLPWSGYFNLIFNCDVFIFLDDAQYSKNSFHNRNRYPFPDALGFKWLAVPIIKQSLSQSIKESTFSSDINWRKKHISTLQTVYGKHPYFKDFFSCIETALKDESVKNLAELNIKLILNIAEYLDLKKIFHRASEINISESRSKRLYNFCKISNCDTYLSPAGAHDYIEEDGVLLNSDLDIRFQNFNCLPYSQRGIEVFQPYMSIIDLIFNEGKERALEYISQPI